MKAFKINNKNDELNNILKVCDKIRKSAKRPDYAKIFYHSQDKTIFATNGICLIVYKTNKIADFLGDIGNGELTVFKDYVIFDDCENLIDYKKPLDSLKTDKEYYAFYSNHLKPAHCEAIMNLAMLGITMASKAICWIDDIANDLNFVEIDSKNKEGAVLFHNYDDTLKFIALPCFVDAWSQCKDE